MLACGGAACAATQADDFLAAREAFRAGDAIRLERQAKLLNDYVLEPYVAYWRLRLRLEEAAPDEVQALLERVKEGPVSGSLRADWLRRLAQKQQWDLFDAEYPQLAGDDVELLCYSLQSRLRAGGPEALSYARTLWFSGRDQPESCTPLFDALAERRQLTEDDFWARIRLALEAGNTGVARRVAEYLPAKEQPDARALSGIAVNPQAYLDRKAVQSQDARRARDRDVRGASSRAHVAGIGGAAVAQGRRALLRRRARLRVGADRVLGAQRHDPGALSWYAKAGELNDLQLAWKARAALRAQSWPDVLAAVDAMSPKESQEPAWRYWKARAENAGPHG